MAKYSDESNAWKNAAEDGLRPYAVLYDHGVLLISLVRDEHFAIHDTIVSRGFASWRAINETEKSRRVQMKARFSEGRAVWDDAEARVDHGLYVVDERVSRTSPGAPKYHEADWSSQFHYRSSGIEKLKTTVNISRHDLESSFVLLAQSTPGTVEASPTASASSPGCTILAVATEWDSVHGGLSTFNRHLCIAMAKAGHRVFCAVPTYSDAELHRASLAGVALVKPNPVPGLAEDQLLCRPPVLPEGVSPDFLIGHDRVTGPAAEALIKDHFRDSRRIQFFHMISSEIEWFKPGRPGPGAAARVEDREALQRILAITSCLVVTVGPRIAREIATLMRPLDTPPLVRLDPGIDVTYQALSPPPALHCLIAGRMEDDKLKGIDIAARAMGIVSQSQMLDSEPILVVMGALPGTGDALQLKLKEIADSPRLQIRVKEYTPDSESVASQIRRSTLMLVPSRAEGFGLAALEAIDAGVPVLVSENSGIGELIKEKCPELYHKVVLRVTTERSADAALWAREVEHVLRTPKEAFALATVLRQKLSASLSWDLAVRQLFVAAESSRRASRTGS